MRGETKSWLVLVSFEVLEHGHCGVAPVDADDAAAGMRACSAEIHAGHGSARSESIGPHVLRQALALKDVAAGESDFLLDVGRAEHLRVNDGGVDVAAEARQGIERQLADFVAALVPGCRRQTCTARIEQRRSWCARRRGQRKNRARFGSRVAPQVPGEFTATCRGEA